MDRQEDSDDPDDRGRKRGPYKQYLEPGQPLVIPKETKRGWSKKAKLDEGAGTSAGETHNQAVPGRSSPSKSGNLTDVDDEEDQLRAIQSDPVTATEESSPNPSDEQDQFRAIPSDPVIPTEESSPSSSDESDEDEEFLDAMDYEDQRPATFADDVESARVCHGGCVCGLCDTQVDDGDEELPAAMMNRKYELDKPIHPALSCSKFEVFLMVFLLFVRHKLTFSAVEDLLKMINTLVGGAVLKTSEYIFRKMFRPNSKVNTHFYCPKCNCYLGEKSTFKGRSKVQCVCGEKCNVKHLKGNYFVTLSVAESIKHFFSQGNAKIMSQTLREDGVYCDILDGALYKEIVESETKKGKNVLTLTFNTDGARVFKSRAGSMWPIQFIINEVDPADRFKDENVFLCGLWFGRGSPCMSSFLKPFVEEMEFLGENGVEVKNSDGSKTLYHVFAPTCSVDSGAKPKLLCQKAGNGRCGCGFCTHPNLPVPGYPANQLRYVTKLNGEAVICENRSHESMISDMLAADDLDRQGRLGKKNAEGTAVDNVNGLLGLSVLAALPQFNVARGFVDYYLHTILLGVVASLIKFWYDSPEHKSNVHDPASQIKLLDERLKSIKPPQIMTSESKLMSDRSQWKGKEFRSFFLFYLLPCLKDLSKFSSRHLKHVQKLVCAFQILLSCRITYEQLGLAEKLLDEFIDDFEKIYGPIHMTLNVNLLKHVIQVVQSWGPMWCYSNFCFESGNGRLVRLVKGTRGVVTQIVEKYLAVRSSSSLMEKFDVSQSVRDFCQDVMNHSYVKKSQKFDDARGLGGEKTCVVTSMDHRALLDAGITSVKEGSILKCYNRIIREGILYYCRAYEKPELFNDTCVKLADNTYAIVERFFVLPDSRNLLAFISPIRLSQSDERLAPLIATGAYDFLGASRVIRAKEIVSKCLLIQFDDQNFVCEIPNPYERD